MVPLFIFSPVKGYSKPGSVQRTVEKIARTVQQQKKEWTNQEYIWVSCHGKHWVGKTVLCHFYYRNKWALNRSGVTSKGQVTSFIMQTVLLLSSVIADAKTVVRSLRSVCLGRERWAKGNSPGGQQRLLSKTPQPPAAGSWTKTPLCSCPLLKASPGTGCCWRLGATRETAVLPKIVVFAFLFLPPEATGTHKESSGVGDQPPGKDGGRRMQRETGKSLLSPQLCVQHPFKTPWKPQLFSNIPRKELNSCD